MNEYFYVRLFAEVPRLRVWDVYMGKASAYATLRYAKRAAMRAAKKHGAEAVHIFNQDGKLVTYRHDEKWRTLV